MVTEGEPDASSASGTKSPVPGRRSSVKAWLPLAGHMLRASRTLTMLVAILCPNTPVLVAQQFGELQFWSWVC